MPPNTFHEDLTSREERMNKITLADVMSFIVVAVLWTVVVYLLINPPYWL